MRKELRKMLISSAALLLLFALVTPSMSATDAISNTAADPTGTSWSDNTPPTANPDEGVIEPVSEPTKDPEPEPATSGMEEPSQPEELQPEIPVVDEDPGDPDNYDYSILKIRGKSNPQGQGYSGKIKKTK